MWLFKNVTDQSLVTCGGLWTRHCLEFPTGDHSDLNLHTSPYTYSFNQLWSCDRSIMILANLTDISLRITLKYHTNYKWKILSNLPDKVLALYFTSNFVFEFLKKNISPTKSVAHENDIVSNHLLDLIWLEVKDQQNFSTSKNGVGVGELDYRLFSVVLFISKSLWFYSLVKCQEENSAIYSQTGGEGQ